MKKEIRRGEIYYFDFGENIKVSSYYEDKLLFGLLNYLEGELKYNNKLDIYYMVNYLLPRNIFNYIRNFSRKIFI